VPAEIDIGPVLLSGVKRLEEWMRIRDKIPSLWAIPVSIQVLGAGVRDPLAARVLALVDDRRSVEEIWLESHTTEFALYSALAGAFERGELKFVVPSAGARVEPPVQPAFRMVSVVDLLDCAAIATDDGDQDLAERYLAAARSLAGEDVERARSACAHAEADESPWPEPEPESARPQGRDPIPMLARRPRSSSAST
jgi:hypothetical protein